MLPAFAVDGFRTRHDPRPQTRRRGQHPVVRHQMPARARNERQQPLDQHARLQFEAYRQVEEIRGVADAKAADVYAQAYNQSPAAVEFYEFTRTMQASGLIIGGNTTLVLSTDSDMFKFLKGMSPDQGIEPVN